MYISLIFTVGNNIMLVLYVFSYIFNANSRIDLGLKRYFPIIICFIYLVVGLYSGVKNIISKRPSRAFLQKCGKKRFQSIPLYISALKWCFI